MQTAVQTSPRRAGGVPAGSSLAIEARGLVKVYPGEVRALDGLSLAVEPGEIFGLLGPNGAGKSTTVKILTTLSRPDSGLARVAGVDVVAQPERVRRTIGCVAQRSGVDKEATGRENLTLQGHFHGMGGRELRRRVDELLDRFGLADHAGRIARNYSGGMQRKLDIAMGLVHRPTVLFLDEPTTGLDPEARADLWAEIARLSGQDGLTILLTTHYLEEADRLARRLAIVDRGRVVVEGTPEALKGELHGDAVHIELDRLEADERVRAALGKVGGVQQVVVEGMAVHTRVGNGATALPAVLAALDAAGITVVSATVARPSLDDVYLRHTGRAYSEASESGGKGIR
jgi:ABC-2 type transport system ATP-binding protein